MVEGIRFLENKAHSPYVVPQMGCAYGNDKLLFDFPFQFI